MRNVFLLLFLFGVCLCGNAQTAIDSLELQLKNSSEEKINRIDILNQLGFEYWIIDSKRSLEFGREALELAKKLNSEMSKAKAHRVIGVAHWTLGQPKEALENLYEAEKLFGQLNDEEGVANCLLNMGMVYADLDDYNKALALYDQAITKFTALQKNDRIATTYTKIGTVYLNQDIYPDALLHFTNALSIHTVNNYDYGISEAHSRLGTLYIKQGELEQADYHIRKSLVFGQKTQDEDGRINNLIQYGKIWRMRGELKTAEDHLDFALEKAKTKELNHYMLDAYAELKEVKKEQGQLDSALFYSDTYSHLKDSIFNSKKSKQIAALEFTNELEEKNLELLLLNEKEKSSSRMKWILFGGIWLILLLGFFLTKSLLQRNKNQKDFLKSQELIAKKTIENKELRQAELEQELAFKNKELTSYTLNFVQKNELLDSVQQQINEAKSESPEAQKKLLAKLERTLKRKSSIDKDWEDFKMHFEQVHTDFLKIIKDSYPSLSSNDLKVAALTRLNLSIKETSAILGISPESAKTARYRLRKKLQLNPEEDLFTFLSKIG